MGSSEKINKKKVLRGSVNDIKQVLINKCKSNQEIS